jgi:hypothetical protein
MKTKTTLVIFFTAAALVVAGCEHIPSARKDTLLNRNFGRAYETAKYNQILHPDAGKNLQPVEGLDGQLVNENMNNYRKGKEKQSRDVLTLETGR